MFLKDAICRLLDRYSSGDLSDTVILYLFDPGDSDMTFDLRMNLVPCKFLTLVRLWRSICHYSKLSESIKHLGQLHQSHFRVANIKIVMHSQMIHYL